MAASILLASLPRRGEVFLMNRSSRRRRRMTILALLIAAAFCLGPMVRDGCRQAGPDPKELAAIKSNRRGLDAHRRGDWDSAIAHFDEAIRSYVDRACEISDKMGIDPNTDLELLERFGLANSD